jgi:hypothetical protein
MSEFQTRNGVRWARDIEGKTWAAKEFQLKRIAFAIGGKLDVDC